MPLRDADTDDLIAVAHIVKTRGLRGELVADLLTDFPDRFKNLKSIFGVAASGARRSLQIEEYWFHGNRIVLKFTGFDSIDAAKELVGFNLAVPVTERVELSADTFYEWELIGCRVETVTGESVGEVKGIVRTGAVEVLTVTDDTGGEKMVPMARDICVNIDVEAKLIRIDPPEGLLDL